MAVETQKSEYVEMPNPSWPTVAGLSSYTIKPSKLKYV